VHCRGKPTCLPICGDIHNTHSPRHAQYAVLRCKANIVAQGQTLPHKGRHAGLPLHGHTDMAVVKPTIRNVAGHIVQWWCALVGALPATPRMRSPRWRIITPTWRSQGQRGCAVRHDVCILCNVCLPLCNDVCTMCGVLLHGRCRQRPYGCHDGVRILP
jgi:hypothetical protein